MRAVMLRRLWLAALLLAACGKSKDAPPRGDTAATVRVDATAGPPTRATTRDLIREAGLCGDRCPPLEAALDRAEGPKDDAVRADAVAALLDQHVVFGSKEARAALRVLGTWTEAHGPSLSAGERETLIGDLQRIVAEGAPGYRAQMYGRLASPAVGFAGVEAYLASEVDNAARTHQDLRVIAETLAERQRELALATRWLRSKDPREAFTGAVMLQYIDHVELGTIQETKRLIVEVATRKGVPTEVAAVALELLALHDDRKLQPGVDALKRHPDPEIAAAAKALVLTE